MAAYAVKEIFATLQGEGALAGTPAVFVRFSGCNLWSGLEEYRSRDSERHNARCPLFCDTDFADGDTTQLESLTSAVQHAAAQASMPAIPLIVLTGGEPLLQLDAALCSALKKQTGAILAVETNGTCALSPELRSLLDWVCVSPKKPVSDLKLVHGQELKVVYPQYKPEEFDSIASNFSHCFVQPSASPSTGINPQHVAQSVAYCLEHPPWRLSLQAHKYVGIP